MTGQPGKWEWEKTITQETDPQLVYSPNSTNYFMLFLVKVSSRDSPYRVDEK